MPSSITLTVSHLPTSTSFFLTALQPLNYAYRCRSGQTIGFGPTSPPDIPPDFWITQEIPGVPAGAAHVAFPAASHEAVQKFFVAALKAGGKVHGEPCVRDQSGYYSAAVIDFDGNSIEAVYRPVSGSEDKQNDVRSLVLHKSATRAPSTVARTSISRTQTENKSLALSQPRSQARSVAPSHAPTTTSQTTKQAKGDVLDTILNEARSAANVARELVNQVKPNLDNHNTRSTSSNNPTQSKTNNNEGPGEVILGTLVGVAAGAALHYAFSSRSKDSDSHENPRGRRPSVTGRSMTEPPTTTMSEYYRDVDHHQQSFPRHRAALENSAAPAPSTTTQSRAGQPQQQYITMHDAATTVRPIPASRRYSFDSGFASGSASSMNSSSSSRPKRHIETKPPPPPPSSYRSTAPSKSLSRSSSLSRTPSQSKSQHHHHHHQQQSSSRRRDSGFAEPPPPSSSLSRRTSNSTKGSIKTILHITETQRTKELPRHRHTTSSPSTSRPSSSSGSKVTAIRRAESPRDIPLPPSRASTWAAGSPADKGSSGRSKGAKRESVASRDSRSVVGKKRDIARLDLPRGELRPSDSVSQI